MEDENLTLDLLYSMLNPDLEQLMTKYSIPTVDCRKLLGALDLLSTYYGMYAMHCELSVAMPTLAPAMVVLFLSCLFTVLDLFQVKSPQCSTVLNTIEIYIGHHLNIMMMSLPVERP